MFRSISMFDLLCMAFGLDWKGTLGFRLDYNSFNGSVDMRTCECRILSSWPARSTNDKVIRMQPHKS